MTKALLIPALLLAALCFSGAAFGEGPHVVSGVVFNYPGELPGDVRGLAGIKPGEPVSERKIRESIKLIYLKGLFENITVEGRITPDGGIELTYDLVPKVRVKGFKVYGNDEVSKKKIIERLVLKEGDFITGDLMEKSKAAVVRLYEEEGYRKARVSIEKKEAGPISALVAVRVEEGPPTVVGELRITGRPGLPEADLYKRLKIKKGDVFTKDRVDRSVTALGDYYLKKDYVKAEVAPAVIYSGTAASLEFKVSSGPKLDVAFQGNRRMSKGRLRKVLTFWDDRDIGEESVSENLGKLRGYYVENGYYFVKVTSRTEQAEAPPTASVTFIIDEGPKVRLGKVTLSGNKEVDEDVIRGVMSLRESSFFKSRPVTDAMVNDDVERIKGLYEAMGFLKADVAADDLEFSKDRTEAELKINIDEGPRTLITKVGFAGNVEMPEKSISEQIKEKPGRPFNPQMVKEDQNNILNLYSQSGYIHAAVDAGKEFTEDGRGVALAYDITEGHRVRVGPIVLRGNEHTSDKVILRELLIRSGDPLDYEKILKSQQRIYKLGFFKQVKIQPVEREDPKGTQDLLVDVKERDAGAVELGVGYGDYDKLRGFSEVSYKNLFGLGHRVSARGEMSFKEKKGLLTYKYPWFLDRQLDFRTSLVYLDAQKPNYNIVDFIAVTGFDKAVGEHFTSSLVYQYEKIKLGALRSGAVLAPEDKKKSNLASIIPSAILDYRDNPFNPRKGSVHSLTVKWATKYLGSTVDFLKCTAQTSWYFPVYKGIVAGVSARGGIEGLVTKKFEVPISERFFLGGASTLRGYKFETVSPRAPDGTPAGGDSMLLFNAEVRFPLPYGFGLVTFLDAGNVWLINKNFTVASSETTGSGGLRYGAGVGLRYETPVGPLRLDYGIKVSRRFPGESASELHFTVGQAF